MFVAYKSYKKWLEDKNANKNFRRKVREEIVEAI